MGALMDEAFDEQRAFTKAILDSVMASVYRDGGAPMTVSPYVHAVFVVSNTAATEAWNWRRTKRELRRIGLKRKGVRREYHKHG